MPSSSPTATLHIVLLIGGLMIAGCSPQTIVGVAPVGDPVSPKRNLVVFAGIDHDLHFAPGASTLTPAEVRSLAAFIRDNGVGEADDVTLILPAADGSALTTARRASVLASLKNLHVAAISDPQLTANAARLKVARYAVTPPHCPDWTKPEVDEETNTNSSNLGCSTETSLALMVANPRDLIHGDTNGGGADGEALARGVALYRSGALSKSLASGGGGSGGAGTAGGGGGGGQ